MIVVSDASPLIALGSIGRLLLLRELYERVLIPEAVHREITSVSETRPGAREVAAADWILTYTVVDRSQLLQFGGTLGRGESEAIILALEQHADFILVDDHQARGWATRLGLNVIGVVGVLIEAKQRNLIPLVKPLLDEMIIAVGFRLGPALYQTVLTTVGEAE